MKKKKNPNRCPVREQIDIHVVMEEVTKEMTFLGWLLVMGALSDFYETTAESLIDLWKKVNDFSAVFQKSHDYSASLEHADKVLGQSMPYPKITTIEVKTEGDKNKLYRKMRSNALYSAFSLIAIPMLTYNLLDEKIVQKAFQGARELNEELEDGRITVSDIQGMLIDEYGLALQNAPAGVRLTDINTTHMKGE